MIINHVRITKIKINILLTFKKKKNKNQTKLLQFFFFFFFFLIIKINYALMQIPFVHLSYISPVTNQRTCKNLYANTHQMAASNFSLKIYHSQSNDKCMRCEKTYRFNTRLMTSLKKKPIFFSIKMFR